MSLLITSSSSEDKTNALGIEKPYQYTNNLTNPLVIPPFSQVAVESVKINRSSNIDYSEGRSSNFWFGERLTSAYRLKDSMNWFIPQENTIKKALPIKDFTEAFQSMMASAYSLHPEINTATGQTGSASFITPGYSATGKFESFKFQLAAPESVAGSILPPTKSEKALGSGSGVYDSANGSIAGTDTPVAITFKLEGSTGGCLSLYNGGASFGVAQTNASDWTVGLARSVDLDDHEQTYYDYNMDYVGGGRGKAGSTFYEYAVEADGGTVKVYHCIPDTAGTNTLIMKEIKYYEKNNGALTANNGVNSCFATGSPLASSAVSQIQFSMANEILTISDQNGSVIVKPNTTSASFKSQIPKPLAQTGWKLYPQVDIWEDNDEVQLITWKCRTSASMKDNYYGNDWPTHCTRDVTTTDGVLHKKWVGARSWPETLDARDVFRQYETTVLGSTIHTYRGIDTDVMASYESLIIGGPSDLYMEGMTIQNWQPNSGDLLGFPDSSVFPVISGISNAFGTSFTSPHRPLLTSESSAFIRTPRLDLQTFNAGTGNPSKILFMLPRFDNAGNESGALYFQSQDRLYIDLNNTDELRITDFTTEIVRKNETFVRDLTGSTEILFHFRLSPKM